MREKLLKALEENFSELVSMMQEIIQVPSISGDRAEEVNHPTEILGFMQDLCKKYDLDYRNIENQVAEIIFQPKEKNIGVLLHLDVVPEAEGWKHPPFGGEIHDDMIWGRGTWDNKQSVAIFCFIIHLYQKLGLSFPKGAKLILGTQEEIGDWSDIFFYLDKCGAPEFCLVPDGSFPICIAEKGFLNGIFTGKTEIDNKFFSLDRYCGGERANMVPDQAEVKLYFKEEVPAIQDLIDDIHISKDVDPPEVIHNQQHVTVIFHGKSAHGSTPEKGINAIRFANAFLKDLYEHHKLELPGLVRFVDKYLLEDDGQSLDIALDHDFLGKTTTNLGQLTYEKNAFRTVLNIRPTIGSNNEELIAKMTKTCEESSSDDFEINFSFKPGHKGPLYVDPKENEDYLKPLREAYEFVMNKPAKYSGLGGTTYAKAVPKGVTYGPLDETDQDMMHQPNERVPLATLKRNAKIYLLALTGLLEG